MNTPLFRSAAAALALSAGLATLPSAHAGTFDAAAGFDLFVTDLVVCPTCSEDDVLFSLDSSADFEILSGDADAFAEIALLDANPFAYDVQGDAFAEGSALAFPHPTAKSLADAYASIEITNATGADVEIIFNYLYTIEATATGNLRYSDAFAEALVSIYFQDLFDALSAGTTVTADSITGPTSIADEGEGSYTMLLAAGDIGLIDIQASVTGVAVPVPPALALMALGLGVLGWTRRQSLTAGLAA
jgi:hypothetical protein